MSALGRARQFIGFEGGTQYPILYECIARRTARSANSGMTIPPLQPGSLSVSENARPIPNFCPNAELIIPVSCGAASVQGLVMVENSGVVQFSCPECGKCAEVHKMSSTLDFNPWIDISVKCERGFDEMRLNECPGLWPEYVRADRRKRGVE